MTKLVVMIPTRNEEQTIGKVIDEIPREIDGIDETEVIIIDGASTDGTVGAALRAGAVYAYSDHINRGLASAFRVGLQKALLRGADIIVNTDADMQYDQAEIPKLIRPILDREADMVLGSRFNGWIEDMPFRKKIGNRIATLATSLLAGQRISDAQSGFRAIHRKLAQRLIIEAKKTYVQETLVRPIRMGYKVVEIPIRFRKRNDESRLISGIWGYAFKAFPDMLLAFMQVAPFKFFGSISLLLIAVSFPIPLAISLFSFSSSLPLIWTTIQFLAPSIILLMGIAIVMDHQERIRRWQQEMKALREDSL